MVLRTCPLVFSPFVRGFLAVVSFTVVCFSLPFGILLTSNINAKWKRTNDKRPRQKNPPDRREEHVCKRYWPGSSPANGLLMKEKNETVDNFPKEVEGGKDPGPACRPQTCSPIGGWKCLLLAVAKTFPGRFLLSVFLLLFL